MEIEHNHEDGEYYPDTCPRCRLNKHAPELLEAANLALKELVNEQGYSPTWLKLNTAIEHIQINP